MLPTKVSSTYGGGLAYDDWGYRHRLDVCNSTTFGNLTGTFCAIWETKNVASDVSSEGRCICREASSNGRYCAAWLCMKQAPGLNLEGIDDGQVFDDAEIMAAFIDNGLQIKGCQCTQQALNGNFCVVWECIKYNDVAARMEAHERYVCDTAYNQSQSASGQVPLFAAWGDYTPLKAATPSALLDQSSNSSVFCAAWTGWKESDRVREEHKCTCQAPSASKGYCKLSLCNQRHQSVAVGYLMYFYWLMAICCVGGSAGGLV
eukprot:jgi/Chrzof1/6181/Cz17g14160.t1